MFREAVEDGWPTTTTPHNLLRDYASRDEMVQMVVNRLTRKAGPIYELS